MKGIAYGWLFGKLKIYLDFTLHKVILASWLPLLAALAVAAPAVLWALQAKVPGPNVPPVCAMPISGREIPTWPAVGLAVLIVGVAAGRRREWAAYGRGPTPRMNLVFAGYFSPSGPEGNLTSGGTARSLERLFLETSREELRQHGLNTLCVRTSSSEAPLELGVLDRRLPPGFARTHDYEGFSKLTGRWTASQLGVVWDTLGADGNIDTLEIAVDPQRFAGGPLGLMPLNGVRRFALSWE